MTTKTELLNNGVVVATRTAAPFYSWDWTPATSGASSLTVKVWEDSIFIGESGATTGTVEAPAGDTTAPTILSATVEDDNKDKLVLVFSEVVNITDVAGLTITGDVTPTLSAPTGTGTNTITFTLSAALTNGQSVTLDVAGTNTIKDVANNALAATTKAITNNAAAASFYEAETTTFMNAVGIADDANPSIYTGVSNNGVWVAVDEYITALKTAAIYNKLHYNYLRLGNTALTQGINLINPSYIGTYSGSWIFDATGAKSNGTNTFFDTGYKIAALNDFGVTITINNGYLNESFATIGGLVESSIIIAISITRSNTNASAGFIVNKIGNDFADTVKKGVYTINSINNISSIYKNGVLKQSEALPTGTLPTINLYEGKLNDDGGSTVDAEALFGTTVYHQGLTSSEITALNNAINTFEAAINRKQY